MFWRCNAKREIHCKKALRSIIQNPTTVLQFHDLSLNVVCYNFGVSYRHFIVGFIKHFFFFVGLKLEAHPLTIATAATLYHRFIKEATLQGYDNYVRILMLVVNKFLCNKYDKFCLSFS